MALIWKRSQGKRKPRFLLCCGRVTGKPDCDPKAGLCQMTLARAGWYGTYFYESEMALISEWTQQCGKKVLDDAGIVRDAC